MGMESVCFEIITPETAAKYLKTSKGNRSLSKQAVNKYARDMKSGNFDCSNDAIVFDPDGHIINGHHRLNAVIKSGQNVKFIVMRNSTCSMFDRGRSRNTEQYLKMNMHYDVQKWEPAMARMHFYYTQKNDTPSDCEIYDFLQKCKSSQNTLSAMCQVGPRTFRIFRNGWAAYALLCAVLCNVEPNTLYRFCEVAGTGFAKDDSESAAIAFRNCMISKKINSCTERIYACSVLQNCISKFVSKIPARLARATSNLIYTDIAIKSGFFNNK